MTNDHPAADSAGTEENPAAAQNYRGAPNYAGGRAASGHRSRRDKSYDVAATVGMYLAPSPLRSPRVSKKKQAHPQPEDHRRVLDAARHRATLVHDLATFAPIPIGPALPYPPYATYPEYIHQYAVDRPLLPSPKAKVEDLHHQHATMLRERRLWAAGSHFLSQPQAAGTVRRRTESQTTSVAGSVLATTNNNNNSDAKQAQQDQRDTKRQDRKQQQQQQQQRSRYPAYLSPEEVAAGLKDGRFVQGKLRINKKMASDAYITVDKVADVIAEEDEEAALPAAIAVDLPEDKDVFVHGQQTRNRALDGDIVVVELIEGAAVHREKEARMRRMRERHIANAAESEAFVPVDLAAEAAIAAVAAGDEEVDEIKDANKLRKEQQRCGRVVAIVERRPVSNVVGFLMVSRPGSFARPASTTGAATPVDGANADEAAAAVVTKIPESYKFIWLKPVDGRMPLVRIRTSSLPAEFIARPQEHQHVLYAATLDLDSWSEQQEYPSGSIARILGDVSDTAAQTAAFLEENNILDVPFEDDCLSCLPETPYVISDEERNRRWDLTDECIYTVDPRTAKDLDDAIHIKEIDQDIYEVGVHIADPSHFVTPHTALDKRAAMVATTTYLVDRAIPMLPRLLCEQLCSLNPGLERLSFSVVWKMHFTGKKAEILHTRLGKSIIKSRAKLAYEDAQRVIDGDEDVPDVTDDIAWSIRKLHALSRVLRQGRFDAGAVTMNNVKMAFILDRETGAPIGCQPYVIREANQMIEELMLMANRSVAEKLYSAMPHLALLRNHPPPKMDMMMELSEKVAKLGFDVQVHSSGALQSSIDAIEDPIMRDLVRQICVRPMMRALYVCSGKAETMAQLSHYALAFDLYTHFTSPIRRYADIIVHRMLEATLEMEADPSLKAADLLAGLTSEQVVLLAKNCNERKMSAKLAGDASSFLYLCRYLDYLARTEKAADLPPKICLARIMIVGDRSIDVAVPEYGVEGKVYYDKMPIRSFEYDAASGTTTVEWRPSGKRTVLSIFGTVSVRVSVNLNKCPPVVMLEVPPIEDVDALAEQVAGLSLAEAPIMASTDDLVCPAVMNDAE